MTGLTTRQREILDFLRSHIITKGRPPTIRAIASHFGHKSTNATCDHLAALERKGFIAKDPHVACGITVFETEAAQDHTSVDMNAILTALDAQPMSATARGLFEQFRTEVAQGT